MVHKDGAGVTSGGPSIPGLEPLSLSLSLFFFAAFSVCLPFAKTKASSFYRFMPYEDWQVGHSALASQGLKTAANICSF